MSRPALTLYGRKADSVPLISTTKTTTSHSSTDYGSTNGSTLEPSSLQPYVVGKPNMLPSTVDRELVEIIYALFVHEHHHRYEYSTQKERLP